MNHRKPGWGVVTRRYADQQHQAAKTLNAEGQCLECGAYRLDGRPPWHHPVWCPSTTTEDYLDRRNGRSPTQRHVPDVTLRKIKGVTPKPKPRPISPWVTILGPDFTNPL